MNKYIKENVVLSNIYLKEIPDILNDVIIEGGLYLNNNKLTTLDNFPKLVDGTIDIFNNPLISLVGIKQTAIKTLLLGGKFKDFEGCPQFVTKLNCVGNSNLISLKHIATQVTYLRLMNLPLKTLEYCPQNESGDYLIFDCNIESLEGLPKNRCNSLSVSFNQLKDFTGAPKIIDGDFKCIGNPITSLKGFPKQANNVFISDFMNDENKTKKEVKKVCNISGVIFIM